MNIQANNLIPLSSFTGATLADGVRPQNAENQIVVLSERKITLVRPEDAAAVAQTLKATHEAFSQALKFQFGEAIANEMLKGVDAARPLELRTVISLANIGASQQNTKTMQENVRAALSTKAMAMPVAVNVQAVVASVRFQVEDADAAARRTRINDLATECADTFEKLVHRNNGKDLGKALLAGKGKLFDAYEAHYDALASLSAEIRDYMAHCQEQEKVQGVGGAGTDTAPLEELLERVDNTLGTLSRTAAVLTEAADRKDKTFNSSRLRELLNPATAKDAGPESAAQLSIRLGSLFEAIDRIDSGSGTAANVADLRACIKDAMTMIASAGKTGDVNRMALRQFAWRLGDADARLKQLEKSLAKAERARKGNAPTLVARSLRDGETIRRVMNGETSVKYLVDMKSAGLTDKMLNPLFDGRNLKGKLTKIGSGAFNTVSLGTFKHPVTGMEAQAVIKMEAPADEGIEDAPLGMFLALSPTAAEAKTLKRNAAVTVASSFIKCGKAVTVATATTIKGKRAIVQELAGGSTVSNLRKKNETLSCGTTFMNLIDGKLDDGRSLTDQQKLSLNGQILAQGNRLEMSDFLTGQMDRHMGNVMMDVESGQSEGGVTTYQVSLKGIDNDFSFPVNRIGFEKFLLTPEAQEELSKGGDEVQGFGDLHADFLTGGRSPALTFGPDGNATLDVSRLTSEQRGRFFGIFGVNNMVKPVFAFKDTYDAVMAAGAEDRFRAEMTEIFGEGQEVESAVLRFRDLKRHLQDLDRQGLVFDEEDFLKRPDLQQKVKKREKLRCNFTPSGQPRGDADYHRVRSYALSILRDNDFGVSKIGSV